MSDVVNFKIKTGTGVQFSNSEVRTKNRLNILPTLIKQCIGCLPHELES